MRQLALLFVWLGVVFANDRIIMTMGSVPSAVRSQISKLSIVEGIFFNVIAEVIRVEGDEKPVTDILDQHSIHYEVEMEKQYTLNEEWNIDRIDQKFLPLDNAPFNPVSGATGLGDGVDIYIIDSGMNVNHEEFQWPDNAGINRAVDAYVVQTLGNDNVACSYHATGVASVAAGKTLGVARKATVHSVKVSTQSGPSKDPSQCIITLATLLEGMLWVLANATKASVINLSLAGPPSVCVDFTVQSLKQAGHFVTDAAGNSGVVDGACAISPARSLYSTTVAYSDIDGGEDVIGDNSNVGDCIDFIAPGQDITVAIASSNSGTTVSSGSSFAAPLVAGAAALIKSHLELTSNGTVTFDDVLADLRDRAVTNNVAGSGSTNYYFLHVGADASLTQPSLLMLLVLAMS